MTAHTTERSREAGAKAGPRQWIGLAVLTLPTMLAMLDLNVMFLALPHITVDLHASALHSLWIADVYGFLMAGFLVTMGRLGDRVGRRKLLFIGAGAFGVLSVAAAFSTSPEMLIAVRALLGVAGATIMPCTLALVRTMFRDPKQMATAMAVWTTATMVGVCLGPPVGGLLLDSFWWGSVFLIAVPIIALLLVTGPAVLPESSDDNAGRLDFASVALSLATILPVVYGLKELARDGVAVVPLTACVLGVLFGVTFVRRQRRLADPLLDMGLFRIRAIAGALTVFMVVGVIQGGTTLLITQHLQLVEGFSPLVAALWLVVPSVVAIAGVQLAMPLAKRFRPAWVLVGGLLIGAAGMVVGTQVDAVAGLATLVIGVCITFAGVSPVPALSNQLTLEAAPPERSGSAGSMSTTSGELGAALGIAALGSLATVLYHGEVRVPSGVRADVAAAANENIADALAAARGLPSDAAHGLVAAARTTFNSAYNTVALVCAMTFLALAVLVFVTLRQVGPIGSAEPESADEPKKARTK